MSSPASPPSSPPKRSRVRRIRAALLVVIGSLVLVGVAIQIVLWSGIPRDIVASQLERQLGVRVEVASVRVGWSGRTAIEDLRLTFPLADQPFLVAPAMRVTHAGLLKILFGRPLAIDTVAVDEPTLLLRQAATGGWNIQQLGRRPPGSGDAAPGDPRASIEIPNLEIHDATVLIIDAADRRTTIEPVRIIGHNRAGFGYDYQATIPERVEITGQINLRSLAHSAAVRGWSLDALIQPWVDGWPQGAQIDARWHGVPTGDGLEGHLEIIRLGIAGNEASGGIDLAARDGGVIVQPRGLNVSAAAAGVEGVLEAGQVAIDGERIEITRLRARSGSGVAEINGQWRLADRQGALDATWRELALPRGVVHSGDAHVDVRQRLDGQQGLTLTTRNRGGVAGVAWEAELTVEALGRSWAAMEWTLFAQRLDVGIGGRTVDLQGLQAVAKVTPQRIVLEEMGLEEAGVLEGQGEVRLDGDRPWWLYVHGRRLPVPDYPQIDAQVMVNAWGDQHSVRLDKMYARIGDLQMQADGHFNPEWETPVVLKVSAYHPTPSGLDTDDDPPLRGGLDAEAFVLGTHQPLSLTFNGEVRGRNLRFQRRGIGDVNVAIHGQVLPNLVRFTTTEGEVLGGRWRFNGLFDQRSRRSVAMLGVNVDGLPLEQVADLMQVDGIAGVLGGEWMITLPQRAGESVTVLGDFSATDLAYTPPPEIAAEQRGVPATGPAGGVVRAEDDAPQAGAIAPMVRIAQAKGRTILEKRRLRFEQIVLTQAEGELRGSASMGVDQPRRWNVDLVARGWELPIPNSPAGLRLTGATDLLIDLERGELTGPIDMAAEAVLEGQPAGQFSIAGRFNGRGVDLPDIHADLFGGRAWGRLTLDVDRPLRSTGTFQFNDLQSERIIELWPGAAGLEGRFNGLMHLRPAQPKTRPVAPLRFSGYITPDGPAKYKHSQIGAASFDLYIDTLLATRDAEDASRLFRVVLDRATLQAFDGRIDLWGRYTQHRGGQMSSQLNIELSDLRLNQIMQTIKEDDRPTPGRIDGSFTLVDNPRDRRRAFGQGSLRLRESELGNIGAFAFLYNLMNIGTDTRQPRGSGSLSVRLEGQTLLLQEMSYFNRGTEVRAVGTFRNIWSGRQADVEATIVGIGRPFRDLKLPFMADVDDIFSALQRNATTVRVSGTIDDPEVRQATFDEIGQGLRGLFLGEIRGE